MRSGAIAVDVASLAVTGLVARSTPGEPARLLEAAAEEVRIEGMNAYVDEAPIDMAAQGGGLRLDALAGLDGTLRAYLTDALWIIDAEIVVPLAQGVVDFNRVVVEHIGPNSSMSVGPRSIHIDAPHRKPIDLFTFDERVFAGAMPEATGASRSRGDRGRLEIAPLLQALLGAPRDTPLVRLADPALERPLRSARVAGELQLGDGALGTAAHHVVLTGRAAGSNRIEVASPALGERVVVRAPALAASAATIAVGARVLSIGSVTASLEVHAIAQKREGASGTAARALAVAIRNATLHGLRLA
jgi:hypothetical protein